MKELHPSCQDPEYFKNYSGSGKSYEQVWSDYSYARELATFLKKEFRGAESFKKILVLGAATGQVLKIFKKKLPDAQCWGCEFNSWAYKQIPVEFRRRIRKSDMRDYVVECFEKGSHFDVAFSNSLIYLPKKDIPKFIKNLVRVTEFLHFNSSFKGHACFDPYRQTTESYEWWNKQFARAGFVPFKVAGLRRSYLWQANK